MSQDKTSGFSTITFLNYKSIPPVSSKQIISSNQGYLLMVHQTYLLSCESPRLSTSLLRLRTVWAPVPAPSCAPNPAALPVQSTLRIKVDVVCLLKVLALLFFPWESSPLLSGPLTGHGVTQILPPLPKCGVPHHVDHMTSQAVQDAVNRGEGAAGAGQ